MPGISSRSPGALSVSSRLHVRVGCGTSRERAAVPSTVVPDDIVGLQKVPSDNNRYLFHIEAAIGPKVNRR
jgi:hypothetical protein